MTATDNPSPLLTLRGLKRLHVGPVDLALSAGECVSVMGHSGAGKSVLLLDEPTSGLDPDAVAQVEALLCAHLARGGGLLLVTHDARQATRLAQRHFFIEDGQLRPHDLSSPNPGAAS